MVIFGHLFDRSLFDRPSGPLKVKAFLYYCLVYTPIALIGISALFIGNYILKSSAQGLFKYIIGSSAAVFGTSLFLVSLGEPFLKLVYFNEAINAPFNFNKVDVSTHPKETAVGVEISNQYDIKKVINEIIKNECDVLGRPYCIQVAKKSGLNIDESGKIKDLTEDSLSDIERVVGIYVETFGKPALYTAQVVLSKYPGIKFTPVYKPI